MRFSEPFLGIGLVTISAVAFAIGPTAAKIAFNDGSNALTVVTLRGIIGATLLSFFIIAFRQSFVLRGAALKWTILCSVFNTVMVYGLFASVQYIPIGVAVLIFFAHPVVIAIYAHCRGGEALTRSKLTYAVIAFVGLALALAPAFERADMWGLSLAAFSTLGICGAILCGAEAQKGATSSQVNFYVTVISTAAFGTFTLTLDAWSPPASYLGWIGVWAAGIAVAIGLLTFFASFRFLGPVRATMLGNIEPVLSVLLAAVILGETLSPIQWFGAGVMIVAIFLFESQDLTA